MNKIFLFSLMAILFATFSACTSIPEKTVIKVNQAEIDGDTAHLVVVSPGSYALVMKESEGETTDKDGGKKKYTEYNFTINVKIRLAKQTTLPAGSIWKVDCPSMNIKLSLLDKDGVELSNFDLKDTQSLEQDLEGLFKSEEGTEKELTFEFSTENKDDALQIMTQAAGIKITGFNTEIYVDPEVQAAKEAAESAAQSSSNVIDNDLNNYQSALEDIKSKDFHSIEEEESKDAIRRSLDEEKGQMTQEQSDRFDHLQKWDLGLIDHL